MVCRPNTIDGALINNEVVRQNSQWFETRGVLQDP